MSVSASCHCGATKFTVASTPEGVTRCTCSYCSKRGALLAYYTPDQFALTTSRDNLATYLWNSKLVQHHFCATCGCQTFSEMPDFSTGAPDFDNPRISINALLLDDVDAYALPLTVIDGKNQW